MSGSEGRSRPPDVKDDAITRTVLDLFERLVELSPDERDILLHSECPDASVRERVGRLLAVHDERPELFDRPAFDVYEDLLRVPSQAIAHYEVIRELGRGGMGSIFLVWDKKLQCERALKVLGAHDSMSVSARAAFLHEARAAAGLNHPNIISIHDHGEAEDVCYIAMQHIPGGTLASWIDERAGDPGGWPRAERVLRIVAQLADALHHAHAQGVVHRDVKPQNVLMLSDEHPVLADFGIARIRSGGGGGSMTEGAGTVAYMSPEQIARDESAIDGRSDVFSLGVVLYEMLTGTHPFHGETPEELRGNILRARPEPLRTRALGYPKDLAYICDRALRRDAKQRYPEAGVLASDIRQLLEDQRVKRPLLSRRNVLITAGGVTLGAVAGVSAWRRLTDDRPMIRFAGPGGPFDVSVAHIDDATCLPGAPKSLGGSSAGPYRVGEGHLRITLRDGDGEIRELTRYAERGAEIRVGPLPASAGSIPLVPSLADAERVGADVERYARLTGIDAETSPPANNTTEMVAMSGDIDSAFDGAAPTEYTGRMSALGDFRIDRAEVTNAQYAVFLATAGQTRPPALWPEGGLGPELWRRPVTGISFHEAQRYAEWRGARLPTWREWERAARGGDGRLYPWGNTDQGTANIGRGESQTDAQMACALPSADGVTPWPVKPDTLDERRAIYLDRVADVLDGADDITPDGLVHMLGNVLEWTESIEPAAGPGLRIVAGHAFSSARLPLHRARIIMDTNAWRIGIGFRCAASLDTKESGS